MKMGRSLNTAVSFTLLTTCVLWISCGGNDNPLDPDPFAGTYALVSFTNKADGITIDAGEELELHGLSGAMTGSAELTGTTFTLILVITPTGDTPIVLTAHGTYTIGGSGRIDDADLTVTVTNSTIPDVQGTETLSIRLSGNRLTIEDDEGKLVFDR